MSKKCYRFFGGLLTVQKNWLNKMYYNRINVKSM